MTSEAYLIHVSHLLIGRVSCRNGNMRDEQPSIEGKCDMGFAQSMNCNDKTASHVCQCDVGIRQNSRTLMILLPQLRVN